MSRIAIVTGATSGIGEATARKFVSAGFGVVGNGRNGEKLTALEHELGSSFCGVPGDASENTILEQLFTSGEERFGKPVDIVVACAGRGLGGTIKDADLSEFEAMLKINVTGTLSLLQKAANKMVEKQEKSYPEFPADIVVIGSVTGRHVLPVSAAYSATKFAVHGMTEALRREMAPKGIRVSLVEPGFTLSGFQKAAGYKDEFVQGFKKQFGPVIVGEDIANAIHFIVTQPPHVHISDIVVRTTKQEYP